MHYGTAVIAARAYKPKDKALVEHAVRLVYQRICFHLKDRVFFVDIFEQADPSKLNQN
ncbi:hypothetical protein [Sphingobacterium sp. B29]|uniref:hypothetical protein n=1 Tax=Sphingobacterium sp. B29 TaxID=1933220 RepID=UPI001560E4FA|nr:hypothetical protein [Sphingobacterium sp. B29]